MNPERDPEFKRLAGERLCAIRNALGMSQEQCAAIIGMTRQAWQSWEEGRVLVNVEMAALFSEERHCTLEWVFRGVPDTLPGNIIKKLEAAVPHLFARKVVSLRR